MTLQQAIRCAERRTRRTGHTYWVVFAPADCEDRRTGYHVATLWDLDTYYAWVPDGDVVYCTD